MIRSRVEKTMKKPSFNHIVPLFWQHGEPEDILREEIRKMHEVNIHAFVIEPRPHPDYLHDGWWRDIDIIIDEAKKHGMNVWLFDDSHYPSGYAAGLIKKHEPHLMKRYLANRRIDVNGPLEDASFLIDSWLEPDDRLIKVLAAKRTGTDMIDSQTLTDLTDLIDQGTLFWNVPEGNWRIFILCSTRNGGEAHTVDYLNPLVSEATDAYLKHIHEAFYARYQKDFGKTIEGFFIDEPRFGNIASYQATLGKKFMEFPYYGSTEPSGNYEMVLPYGDDLIDLLSASYGQSFELYLPLLWYDDGHYAPSVRYTYMDTVSRLFDERFIGRIGDWCRAHGVKLMGHAVEDSGSHARLGFGSGHLFRTLAGLDYPGFDLVYQVWPEYTEGRQTTPFGYLESEFFYWGISKLASSIAHTSPNAQGITMVELFGAYGWQAGLKLMKWLTDHVAVRGVNLLVPHAFSPKDDDKDCPPHFYSRGKNPQWKHFDVWSNYANRLSELITGGTHVASVAVLYHAEAEWAGAYMPFETVVKALSEDPIDCDILSIDRILEIDDVQNHAFKVKNETYQALVIPYAERLPKSFLTKVLELKRQGVPIFFIDQYPSALSNTCENDHVIKDVEETLRVLPLSELAKTLRAEGIFDIEVEPKTKDLRYYHMTFSHEDRYLFTNESTRKTIDVEVTLKTDLHPSLYDVLMDEHYDLEYEKRDGSICFNLTIEPYQSLALLLTEKPNRHKKKRFDVSRSKTHGFERTAPWRISTIENDAKTFRYESEKLGNLSKTDLFRTFSGTFVYETTFSFDPGEANTPIFIDFGRVGETCELYLNGKSLGKRIVPPYRYDVTDILKHANELVLYVTNTFAKERGNNIFDRAMPQEPSGLLGPVNILTK